jgi:aspartate kinase
LQTRAVEFAKKYNVPIHCRSSFHDGEGSWVLPQVDDMERTSVTGVAYDRNTAKLTVEALPDVPGTAAALFRPLAEAQINVDVIVQNVGIAGHADVSFTVHDADVEKAQKAIEPLAAELEAGQIVLDQNVAKISIVGSGIRSNPGYADRMFTALADEGINILSITTSEIRITCLIERDKIKTAVKALHQAFELEKA